MKVLSSCVALAVLSTAPAHAWWDLSDLVDVVDKTQDAIGGIVDKTEDVIGGIIEDIEDVIEEEVPRLNSGDFLNIFGNLDTFKDECDPEDLVCLKIAKALAELEAKTREGAESTRTQLEGARDKIESAWGDASTFLAPRAATTKDYMETLMDKAFALVPHIDGNQALDDAWGWSEGTVEKMNEALQNAAVMDFAAEADRMTAFWNAIKSKDTSDLEALKKQAEIYGMLMGTRMQKALTTFRPFVDGATNDLPADFADFVASSSGVLDKINAAVKSCSASMQLDKTCSPVMLSRPTAATVEAINEAASKMCTDNAECVKTSLAHLHQAVECGLKPFTTNNDMFQGWPAVARDAFIQGAKKTLLAAGDLREQQVSELCEKDAISGNSCESVHRVLKATFADFATKDDEHKCMVIKRAGCCASALKGYLPSEYKDCELPRACPTIDEIAQGVKVSVNLGVADILSMIPEVDSVSDLVDKLNVDAEFFSKMTDKIADKTGVDVTKITIGDIDTTKILSDGSFNLDVLVQGGKDEYEGIKDKVKVLTDGSLNVSADVFGASGDATVTAKASVTEKSVVSGQGAVGGADSTELNDNLTSGTAAISTNVVAFAGLTAAAFLV